MSEAEVFRQSGASLGVSFSGQSTALMSGNSGTDARFPSKVRQNVVVDWCIDLLREQEVAGSNPVAPTYLPDLSNESPCNALHCGGFLL